jgi:hypothetical protein
MSMGDFLGKVAFIVGMLFAIIGGIWGGTSLPTNDAVVAILLICGIFIGLLNVTAKEAPTVLAATVALIIVGLWGVNATSYPVQDFSQAIWENTVGIVCSFAILMLPAAVIIAIKAVIATAQRN